MKATSIQAMLSDPRIDPTEWVGKALLTWINNNPLKCLSDSVAREYLFQGMEMKDALALSEGVVTLYNANQDPLIIQRFVQAVNRMVAEIGNFDQKWALHSVIRSLNESADENTIDHLVNLKIPHGDDTYKGALLKFLKPYHIKPFVRNRKPDSSIPTWKAIVSKTPSVELFEFITGEVWDHITGGGFGPVEVQDILWDTFIKLPDNDATKWLAFLEKSDVTKLWRYANEALVSKKWSGTIKFSEIVCRCGKVSANKSGHTLHKSFCASNGTLFIAAKILMADTTGCLICNKCGKTCRSKPGIALHQKKCKAEYGDKIREARKTQAIKELGKTIGV